MLYFGPETYMPLASAILAAAGIAVTFWRRLVAALRSLVSRLRRPRGGGAEPGP